MPVDDEPHWSPPELNPAPFRARGALLEPGRVLAERYVITGFIGSGGMGVVYSARHARTGRELALKVLLPALATRPDVMQRFMAEARAAGSLNHPGIVEVVDLDRDGDMHFIAMERLEGEELLARIKREHPLDPGFVARVGADIADAIGAAHAHTPKIIHRDLKPQNVILATRGRQRDIVKIVDFGIAKLLEAEVLEQSLTRSGEIYGTPLYMSPEQLRNNKEVDERSDIYAIGVIMFQALAGVTPFQGESFSDLVVRINTEEPAPLRRLRPDVPEALLAVVERAMARSKNERYPTAALLRDALLGFASERPPLSDSSLGPGRAPSSGHSSTRPTVKRTPQSRRGLVLAIGFGLVGGATLGGLLRSRRKARQAAAARARAPAVPVDPAARVPAEASQAAPEVAPPEAVPAVPPPARTPPATTGAAPAAPRPPRGEPRGGRKTGHRELPPLRPR